MAQGRDRDVGLDAASVDVLCKMLSLDYDKTASTNQLQHGRKGLLATAQHKSGKPRLLLSYSDGRTKISRLSSMLPRVANLVIREAPVNLTSRATHAHPTSPRSIGFCAIWGCISSSSSSSLTSGSRSPRALCRGSLRLTAAYRAPWPS